MPVELVAEGIEHHKNGRLAEAETCYRRALAAQPDNAEAYHLLGIAAHQSGRIEESIEFISTAIKLNGHHPLYFCNLGVALEAAKQFEAALVNYGKALALYPDFAQALSGRGSALSKLGKCDEALVSYDRALALNPDFAEAHNNRGNVLCKLGRCAEALESYDGALALSPNHPGFLMNRGNALQKLGRLDEALASYDEAISISPGFADAFCERGVVLQELNRLEEAAESYEKALSLQPSHPQAFGGLMWCASLMCDWARRTAVAASIRAQVTSPTSAVVPFTLLAYSTEPALQQECAAKFTAQKLPHLPRPFPARQARRGSKVRLAYLSADFRLHATAHLIVELLERHDRSRFELIGVSFGADDGSEMRRRVAASFDRFVDVCGESDGQAAALLHQLSPDIAIDLMGHTKGARPGILACRPAPIQACYLGYPATAGMPFIDYIIADKIVAPFEHERFYTEKIVHLPHCYQVNGTGRETVWRPPSRLEAGLPENAFVFCCFNRSWKITPDVFDIWVRLLNQVENSVLWLLRDNETAERNLRNEARGRGLDPRRLVFAGTLPNREHLARHRLADLFLDTLPCNAHTAASDALWAGVPLVTRLGDGFAGRVAASVLEAIRLPELITHDAASYEALALQLAADPGLLDIYRRRLERNRATHPLFDTVRFQRHLEAAYLEMLRIWLAGEKPRRFSVGSSLVRATPGSEPSAPQ